MDTLKVKTFEHKVLKARTEVKQTASKNAKTLIALQKNIVVENYGAAGNGWSYIKVRNTSGYVATNSLKSGTSTKKYVTAGSYIYASANNKQQVGHIEAEKRVTVLSTVGNYSFVVLDKKYGYIDSQKLVLNMAFSDKYLPNCNNFCISQVKFEPIVN